MHHFFDAITNTSGDSLIGYYGQVIDRTTNNVVAIAADDNGTPIITTSGIENMAKTDAYGNLDFYVAPGTYNLNIYAPNGTSLQFRVPNVAMNSTKGDTGAPGAQGDPGPAGQGLADVMAPSGSSLVGYRVASTTPSRTVNAKLAEVVSAFDYGAKGDASIDEAPNLQALVNTSAVNANGVTTRTMVPRGRYNLGTSVKLPNYTNQQGEGPSATRIFGNPSKPCLENQDTNGFVFHTLTGVQLNGGTHGIYISSDTDNLTWRDVEINNPTVAGVEFNGFLQTALFEHLRIAGGPFGIKSNTTIANNVVLIRPDITATETAIYLRGTEDFTVIGGRFEGGGSATKSTVDVQAARALQFIGSYFEGGSNPLLKARNSKVSFWGTHFTFQQAGVAYTWDVDASSQLHFFGCHSTIPMVVPAGSIVENCVNITAASTYNSSAVDADNINRATGTLQGSYWREAAGIVRFHVEIVLNGAGPSFLKVALPPIGIAQSAAVQAYNATALRPIGALANQGDANVYVTGPSGFPGAANDRIVIDGVYRSA